MSDHLTMALAWAAGAVICFAVAAAVILTVTWGTPSQADIARYQAARVAHAHRIACLERGGYTHNAIVKCARIPN